MSWHWNRLATWVVVGCGISLAGAAVGASACIPDLPDEAAGDDAAADQIVPDEGGQPPPRCGDGVIQLSGSPPEQCDPGPAALDGGTANCSSTCQVLCPGGLVWPRNNHCYTDVPDASSALMLAEALCPYPSHVVTFASAEEERAVVGALDGGSFWVGLLPKSNFGYPTAATFPEPGWWYTCPGCYARVAPDATALPGSANFTCVTGPPELDASWQSGPCTTPAGPAPNFDVICEREPIGRSIAPCSSGLCFELPFTLGYKDYVYVANPASSTDAADQCAALGGTLVVLQSSDEREQLWLALSRLQQSVPTGVWIGLSLPDGGNPADPTAWTWANDAGADAYPSEWAPAQPNTTSGAAVLFAPAVTSGGVGYSLARNDQTGPHPFVCQIAH